ncbi:MAG: TauD/TfdA family dioxygenase [Alphaproteobacteria bacterium]|nr:TauD/TfdA family dioxygenase [Alphaproteobacteria bacterium]
MKNTAVTLRPMSANTGMEVLGADLREPLSEAAYLEMRHALCDTGVICFRGQDLSCAQHLAFAKRFGDVPPAEFLKTPDGFPEIGIVGKEPDETRNVGGNWHSDHSFDTHAPLGAVLYARELPERGGDTLFANMGAAFDSLTEGLKQTLRGLEAVHAKAQSWHADTRPDRAVSAAEMARHDEEFRDRQCVHPVVTRHPETGREILFINPTYTSHFVGWSYRESRPLLDYLFAHATSPENTCRFHWEEGSIAFWDNRSALHYALNDYHGQRRIMHRATIYAAGQ